MNKSLKIHNTFKNSDFDRLKKLAGDDEHFPDIHLESFGHVLEYAIYHSSLSFIKQLLAEGAGPEYSDHAGFPCIIAALSAGREDVFPVIEELLRFGADINQRGINDWTPLHFAAVENHPEIVRFLLEKGADPSLRTRIDDYATPLEEAEHMGSSEAANILKEA